MSELEQIISDRGAATVLVGKTESREYSIEKSIETRGTLEVFHQHMRVARLRKRVCHDGVRQREVWTSKSNGATSGLNYDLACVLSKLDGGISEVEIVTRKEVSA